MTRVQRTNAHLIPMADLPSPLVYPLEDNERLVELIAEVMERSTDWVAQAVRKEEQCLGEYYRQEFQQFAIPSHQWSDGMVAYYQQSDAGVLGCATWNRRPEKLAMREWIGRYLAKYALRPLKILTIGDGTGYDSLYLSLCGHDVTYSEESTKSIAFARKIFSDARQPICVIDDWRHIEEGQYDLILCLDVLEHVPDPPATVAQFARYLRTNGLLIVHAPFFFVSWHNPTHLTSNRKYSGDLSRLYHAQGFRLIDGRFNWDPLVLLKGEWEGLVKQQRTAWAATLRLSGLLLAVGRYWNAPHNWIAGRAMQTGDARWLLGLSPPL